MIAGLNRDILFLFGARHPLQKAQVYPARTSISAYHDIRETRVFQSQTLTLAWAAQVTCLRLNPRVRHVLNLI